jgi:hypothetical protein
MSLAFRCHAHMKYKYDFNHRASCSNRAFWRCFVSAEHMQDTRRRHDFYKVRNVRGPLCFKDKDTSLTASRGPYRLLPGADSEGKPRSLQDSHYGWFVDAVRMARKIEPAPQFLKWDVSRGTVPRQLLTTPWSRRGKETCASRPPRTKFKKACIAGGRTYRRKVSKE